MKYKKNFLYTKEEWTNKITIAIDKLKTTNCGNILLREIYTICDNNTICNLTIVNEGKYQTSVEYPKCTYYEGKIDIQVVIPYNYRINVDVIETGILPKHYISDKLHPIYNYIARICNRIEVTKEILELVKKEDSSNIKHIQNCIYKQEQPFEIMIAHELIHGLRLLSDNHTNHEEESTIFGVKNKTLIIDGILITENSIRNELGYPNRINDNGDFIK